MKIVAVIVGIIVVFATYVRVAPSNPEMWNVTFQNPQDRNGKGSATRVLVGEADRFDELEEIILATSRTKKLIGSSTDGVVTYVTRSLIWGFPDYTTVWKQGEDLVIYGRLRFGGGDMGVNRQRIEGWIAALNRS